MKLLFVSFFLLLSIIRPLAQPPKPLEDLFADLQLKKDTAYVNTLLDIGLTYRLRSNIDSSRYYFAKCITLAEAMNYTIGVCRGTYGLGDLFMYEEKRDSALLLFLDALKLTEKMRDEKVFYQARVKQRIGMFYLAGDDVDKALKYLKETEQLSAELKDTSNLIDLSKDFAYIYGVKKDSATALSYYKTGMSLCNALEKSNPGNSLKSFLLNRQRINLIRNTLGFFNTTDLNKEALVYLESIWNQKDNPGHRYNTSQILVCMTRLYRLAGQYQKSIEYGTLAMEDVDILEDSEFPLNLELAMSYYAVGNFKEAYENMEKYIEDYEKRYESEKFAALSDLETKYQTEKKEQEIVALNKEKKDQRAIILIASGAFIIALGLFVFALRANRLQKKLFAREKELQKKDMEKRMFELEQTALRAQMNPHFIFNSLNSVQRFVINNDVEGVNHYLSTFANLIRQTLENSGKQLIPLKDEVRYLETYLRLEQMRGNERFTYKINVNPDIDPEDTYIPNMIIQPYLENSVIHGMAGKKEKEGIINLTISRNHKLTCVVEDNGAGIKASRTYKTETSGEYESMGTAITEKRIQMFNTISKEKIELQVLDRSELGSNESGTRIMIKFPINSN